VRIGVLDPTGYGVFDECIMQTTGVHDKNEVEIYEGDIVSFAKGVLDRLNEKRGQIVWDKKEYVILNELGYLSHHSHQDELWGWHDWIEVIGNIYENPELLTSN
jgi:uncharacterized phage protein (TIGR01671 family)